jgi:L-aspartate oxidase
MTSRNDFRLIIVGSGISGLFVALEARHLGPVLVLTKGSIEECNTRWAQGGIAAAVGPLDSPEQHLTDTIEAGAGLVDEEAARILCTEAPGRIADLVTYGVAFDSLEGQVALGREAAHSHSRILHAGGDRTGAAIETALAGSARAASITILDFSLATRLLVRDGAVRGVEAIDLRSGTMETYTAPAVVLATGGAGQLFSHTTNPDIATGDGIALAFDAGAELMDLEFYQFHPTALRLAGSPPFLISEAVRGEGAVLRNRAGEAFMPHYDPGRKDLAARDIVARAIVAEMRAEGSDAVSLDCSHVTNIDLATRFPGIYAYCRSLGIDMRSTPIPVAPAAHYFMGGVRTDVWGRTTVPGLYACGEVACTGVHGANRLASNSLMETVVFGKRVVDHLSSGQGGGAAVSPDARAICLDSAGRPDHATIQATMWQCCGIERTKTGLERGRAELAAFEGEPAPSVRIREEARQMTIVSNLMLEAALCREESRGGHFRSDFPLTDDARWKCHQVFRRG